MTNNDETRDFVLSESQVPENVRVGSRIDQFHLEKELGSGGFGTVYAATDTLMERRVAIKLFHESSSSRGRLSLVNEARKASKLKHKHIAEVYHVDSDARYLVMQYIDGKDLGAIIKTEGPLPQRAALKVVLNVASGLQHAHSMGILHLDIKPSNIVVSNGQAVLTDFGIAITDEEKWKITRRGTPAFMAPEQLGDDQSQLDGRTDLWALGCVLYQMITTHHPFEAKADQDLVHAITAVAPKPPSQWNTSVSKDVEDICLRCLHKNIEDRFESATQLIRDAKAAQDALEDEDVDEIDLIAVSSDSRRQFIATGCLVLALVVTTMTLVMVGIVRPEEARRVWRWIRRRPRR